MASRNTSPAQFPTNFVLFFLKKKTTIKASSPTKSGYAIPKGTIICLVTRYGFLFMLSRLPLIIFKKLSFSAHSSKGSV